MKFTDFILSTKRAVMVLFTVLMVHLIALGYYTEYNRKEDKQLFYTEVIHQILELIHLTETAATTTVLNAQLAKINFKNIIFTLDVTPIVLSKSIIYRLLICSIFYIKNS